MPWDEPVSQPVSQSASQSASQSSRAEPSRVGLFKAGHDETNLPGYVLSATMMNTILHMGSHHPLLACRLPLLTGSNDGDHRSTKSFPHKKRAFPALACKLLNCEAQHHDVIGTPTLQVPFNSNVWFNPEFLASLSPGKQEAVDDPSKQASEHPWTPRLGANWDPRMTSSMVISDRQQRMIRRCRSPKLIRNGQETQMILWPAVA